MPMLPYLRKGTLQKQDGTVIALNIPVSVWPANGVTSRYGEYFDHQAEASPHYVNELVNGPANRRLVIDGVKYNIVQATPHDFLPHVELTLRRVKAGGP
jgi:hypothetical protein